MPSRRAALPGGVKRRPHCRDDGRGGDILTRRAYRDAMDVYIEEHCIQRIFVRLQKELWAQLLIIRVDLAEGWCCAPEVCC